MDRRLATAWARIRAKRTPRDESLLREIDDLKAALAASQEARPDAGMVAALREIKAFIADPKLVERWDDVREMLLEGNRGDYPRLCFESWLGAIEEIADAALQGAVGGAGAIPNPRPIVRIGPVRVFRVYDGSYVASNAGGWLDGSFPTVEAALAAATPPAAPAKEGETAT